MTYELTAARTVPVRPEAAFDAVATCDLRQIFDRRFMMLAPVARFETDAAWPAPDGQRSVWAADGSSFCETMTRVEEPRLLEYTMTEIGGPLRLVAQRIRNRWTFDPHPSGTRIAWTWEVDPPHRVGAHLEPVFRPQWGRYARRAMDRLEMIVDRTYRL